MKIKNLILTLFVLLFNNTKAQDLDIENLRTTIDKELNEWPKSFENFNWDDFIEVDSIAVFENLVKQNFKDLKKFQSVYDPIISYSENKNKFIDIYSYQLNLEKKDGKYYSLIDVGQAIFLCDIKNKYWTRIMYSEYSMHIDDVVWIDEFNFLLVGTQRNDYDKNIPIIYFGNLNSKSFRIIINSNENCIRKEENYISKKLKNIKIQN